MTPSDIVGMAQVNGLDAIALTDHNSAANCPAFIKAAEKSGLTAIAGTELTTAEEIHVICLFRTLDGALSFGEFIESRLPKIKNDPKIFGRQLIMNEDGAVIGEKPYLLINALPIGFDDVYDLVAGYGGIMIPAHLDKSSTSLISSLGFIPPGSKFTCAEIKHKENAEEYLNKYEYLKKCRIISNSDAHSLWNVSERTNFIESKSNGIDDIFESLLKKE